MMSFNEDEVRAGSIKLTNRHRLYLDDEGVDEAGSCVMAGAVGCCVAAS